MSGAVADQVITHVAARGLGANVAFADRRLDRLRDLAEDLAFRNLGETLPEDADRLERVAEIYESQGNFAKGKKAPVKKVFEQPGLFDGM